MEGNLPVSHSINPVPFSRNSSAFTISIYLVIVLVLVLVLVLEDKKTYRKGRYQLDLPFVAWATDSVHQLMGVTESYDRKQDEDEDDEVPVTRLFNNVQMQGRRLPEE